MISNLIEHSLEQARLELDEFIADPQTIPAIERMASIMADSLRNGGKVIRWRRLRNSSTRKSSRPERGLASTSASMV